MITWKNLDTLKAYDTLKALQRVCLQKVMSGEEGEKRGAAATDPLSAAMEKYKKKLSE